MRLKCIRLAGFKSFVDPTTVNFPSNMAAVVGPNGCGKSNIIDAVRWVMGESSAKNLRGESMTDVIFNGSTSRKPVSQASIELVFDNSDGTLLGEYAAYAEISIRRKVTRDSQNTYYLNGTKCRRRDITDIFLGTGLGPRSYSIIEQGMISKLIEARPEDLRNFIEEAAGISKYKERRRETESRIRRTHENLERLTDLREELERQLDRLHRQAQAAEKYQEYKAEERQLKAQLSALRWQALNEQVAQREAVIGNQEVGFEALVAEQRSADASIERLRDGHHDLSERFNLVQGRFYSVGGDIARVEQSIQHGQQRLRQLQDDLQEAERSRQETESHLGHDSTLLATLGEELEMLEPEQELTSAAAEEAAATLEEAETGMQGWQEQWDSFNTRSAEPRRQAEVQQSRIQQLEQSMERLAERQRRLDEERQLLAADPEDAAILALGEQLATGQLLLEDLQLSEEQQVEQLEQTRQDLLDANLAHQQAQGELQRLNGRLASLEALQQAALDPGTGTAQWLREQALEQHPRLAEDLRVDAGWELAVETVLGADLQAVLVDELGGLDLAAFVQGDLRLLTLATGTRKEAGTGTGTGTGTSSLLDKINSPHDLAPWLARVRPVDSFDEALALRVHLADGDSLISRDGYWVGRHFLRISRASDAHSGMLARGQELQALAADIQARESALALLDERQQALREQQGQHEQSREQLRRRIQDESRQLGDVKAQLSAGKAKVEQLILRRRRLDEELTELAEQRAVEHEQVGEARLYLQDALDVMADDTEQREKLVAQRDHLREHLDRIRQEARIHKDSAHQLAVRLGSLRAQHASTRQALERLQLQSERLTERREQLNLGLEEGEAPLEELRLKLEELLEKRMTVDEQMRQARMAMEDADRELRDAEKRRSQAEQQSQLLRGQLEQYRMEWQALSVRRTALADQLREDGYDLHGVLATLDTLANEREAEEELERINQRIQRLGAINLAAIEEYQQQSERKRYLDAQNADLVEALDTLENVIRKIDKETRNRFKDTFDQINTGLQALFPKVFGGGSAYLELTGEDLLDTGVSIMARPPGKKNSTIHLLSGGEKALTALALVFSIFQLNPAPFCMLDEVDAPLDDANVGRYARLVKEMSQTVQFIYITHNKIAMEMADQLMGVTMHEPGCSRLVAVDVEEAMKMVDA